MVFKCSTDINTCALFTNIRKWTRRNDFITASVVFAIFGTRERLVCVSIS